jgi:hypothetical protein
VTAALVDLLETVEVNQEHGQLTRIALVPNQLIVEPLVQQAVVADVGERIAGGEVTELGGAALEQLTQVSDDG